MRIAWAALVVVGISGSAARAEVPVTFGAFVGSSQSERDAEDGYDATTTAGLFGRASFGPRFSAQLEARRMFLDQGARRIGVTVAGVVDLAHWSLDGAGRSTLVPLALVGLGAYMGADAYGSDNTDPFLEAGLGVEYRWAGGLVVGADARLGSIPQPEEQTDAPVRDVLARSPGYTTRGEYRSVRLTVGMRF